jgi:hypothetical protein
MGKVVSSLEPVVRKTPPPPGEDKGGDKKHGGVLFQKNSAMQFPEKESISFMAYHTEKWWYTISTFLHQAYLYSPY